MSDRQFETSGFRRRLRHLPKRDEGSDPGRLYGQKTASSQGERLLRNAEVRAAVDAALAKVADRAEVTAERVIRERARLAFFDPRKLLDADGNPIPMQDLDDDTAAAIAGLDVATSVSEDGSTKTTVRRYRLRQLRSRT
jgi:phage terminase small subunit